MKILRIGRKLKTFSGKEMTDMQKEGEDKAILVKDIVIQYVGQLFEDQNKERVLRAFKLAGKVYDCQEEYMNLEDAEFDLIVEATKKPKMNHSPLIMGPLYEEIETAIEAAKTSGEAKPKKKE